MLNIFETQATRHSLESGAGCLPAGTEVSRICCTPLLLGQTHLPWVFVEAKTEKRLQSLATFYPIHAPFLCVSLFPVHYRVCSTSLGQLVLAAEG